MLSKANIININNGNDNILVRFFNFLRFKKVKLTFSLKDKLGVLTKSNFFNSKLLSNISSFAFNTFLVSLTKLISDLSSTKIVSVSLLI